MVVHCDKTLIDEAILGKLHALNHVDELYVVASAQTYLHHYQPPTNMHNLNHYNCAIVVMIIMRAKVIVPFAGIAARYCEDTAGQPGATGICVYSTVQIGYMAQAFIIAIICVFSGIGVSVSLAGLFPSVVRSSRSQRY